MAAHSSILAWEIPRTEEPGGLQSWGSQSSTRLSTRAHLHNTPALLPCCSRTCVDPGMSVTGS